MIGMGSISSTSELYVRALASKALAKYSPNVAPLQFIGMWPLSANRYASRTAVNSSREVQKQTFLASCRAAPAVAVPESRESQTKALNPAPHVRV